MSKRFHSPLFTPPPEHDEFNTAKKQKSGEQTMKCRVRIAKIALHEKFPGINNEGQALDISDPNYDDSDYSEILKVVRNFLKKEAEKAVAEERVAEEEMRLAIRLQVTNMGQKILPMICGKIILYLLSIL